ncbi:MAG: Abi family protein [Peptoanaerobacter stomatis]
MNKYDMPFLTYEQQVDRLINKYNLIISDTDFAKKILNSISYYDLINGYKDIFMKDEKYLPTISIEYLYVFHIFNRNMQNILFKYSLYVENTYKNNLAYVLGSNWGVDIKDYLNLNNYAKPYSSSENKKRVDLITKLQNMQNDSKIDNPTKHYMNTHNHIPPWILFKNVSWGDTIDLFKFLEKRNKQEVIHLIMKYKSDPKFKAELVSKSLTISRKYRNKIAHNLKFVTYKCPEYLSIKIVPYSLRKIIKNTTKIDGPFSMIISLIILLNDTFLIYEFYNDLLNLIRNTQANILNDYFLITDIPTNLLEILKEFIIKEFS